MFLQAIFEKYDKFGYRINSPLLLPGMSRQLQTKDKIEPESSIKIAPFKKDIRNTTAHKHNNCFEIIYLSRGSGFHYIHSRRFAVKPPVMYFIRKEQVHY